MDYESFKRSSRYYELKITRYISKFAFSQETYLLIIGGITGFLAGIGAIVFHEAINFIKDIFFDLPGRFFGEESLLVINDWKIYILIAFIPAVGGLLVGLLAHYFEKGEKGEGIPNVIDAVASKGGIIKGNVAVKKIIGSALSIGTGGAGGREGPIVQIGASIASAFGQLLHLSPNRLKIIVGCGAAAGLSAAFNAPLGGALFAMEIILRTFRAQTFSPIIIASVIATALSRSYLGNEPAFEIPTYELLNNIEFGFYIILGFLAGLTSVYFVKVFYSIEGFFGRLKRIPPYLKPALGGLMVGIIGVFLPGVFGFSYVSIDNVLDTRLTLLVVTLLLFLKPIATATTIGSGGNGGTFAPSLFTGAMLGGAFGIIINNVFPNLTAPAGAYALVGMGAVVAGTTNASLTALIMVFEMTNNYKIILPLMLTIIISTTLSKAILGGSLYTLKFKREGKEIDIYGRKISILQQINVVNLINRKFDYIYEDFNFRKIIDKLKETSYNSILVLDRENRLAGQITFQDIRDAILDEEYRNIAQFLIAKDVMRHTIETVYEDQNGEQTLKKLEFGDYEYLPVLDRNNNKVIGIISKESMINKYQKELFIQESRAEFGPG